jgi:hypothetical protein
MITDQDLKDIEDYKYKDFQDFTSKNPDKIHWLELRES